MNWRPLRLDWGAEIGPDGELGTWRVPECRSDPHSAELSLAAFRWRGPAGEESEPLVFLAGGPGESGIDWLRPPRFRRTFERLRAVGDLVFVDQRGCGRSERALPCGPYRFADRSRRETLLDAVRAHASEHRNRFVAEGACLEGYTPLESAQDLIALLETAGWPRVRVLATSYGTHLAMAAIKLAPDRFSRAVFAGFEGPDQTYKLPEATHRQWEKIVALARAQGASDDLDRDLREALEHDFGAWGLRVLLTSWIGLSNRLVWIPDALAALRENRREGIVMMSRTLDALGRRSAVFWLKDGSSGASAARRALIARQASLYPLADAANFPFPEAAAFWGAPDLGDTFRADFVSDLPILLVTGTLDGFTPTEQAEEARAGLPHSAHLVIENAAHNDLLAHPEAVERVAAFLAGEPTGDERLAQDPPPFRPLPPPRG